MWQNADYFFSLTHAFLCHTMLIHCGLDYAMPFLLGYFVFFLLFPCLEVLNKVSRYRAVISTQLLDRQLYTIFTIFCQIDCLVDGRLIGEIITK